MCSVPISLIGYKGYTGRDALLVCNLLRRDAPKHPKLEKVLALENEMEDVSKSKHSHLWREGIKEMDYSPPTLVIPNPSMKQKRKNIKILKIRTNLPKSESPPNPEDYPTPWCKVSKDGKLMRYEDANGRAIPEVLWMK